MNNTEFLFKLKVDEGQSSATVKKVKQDLNALGAQTSQVTSQSSGAAGAVNSMTASFGSAATGSLVLKNNLEGVALKLAGLRQAGLMARQVFAPMLNELNGEFLQTIGLSKETANAVDLAKSIAGGVAIGAMSGAAFGPWGAGIGAAVGGGSAAVAEWMKAHKAEAQNIEERKKLILEARKIGQTQVEALSETLRKYANSQATTRAQRNLTISAETSEIAQRVGLGGMLEDPVGDPKELLERIERERTRLSRQFDAFNANATAPGATDAAKKKLEEITALDKAAKEAIRLDQERQAIQRADAQSELARFRSEQALELQALETAYENKSKKDEDYIQKRLEMMRDLHFEEAKLDAPDDRVTNDNLRAAQRSAFERQLRSGTPAPIDTGDPFAKRITAPSLGHLASIGGNIDGTVATAANTYYQRTANAVEKTLAKVEKIVAGVEKIAQHSGAETVAHAAA